MSPDLELRLKHTTETLLLETPAGLKTGLDVLKRGFVGTGWLSEPRVDSGGTSALVLPPFSGLEDSWFNQETE